MKSIQLLIKNAFVLCMDEQLKEIPQGCIAVDHGKIIAIGTPEELQHLSPQQVFDANGKLAMPGLVNTHTHASMTLFRGYADDLPLHTWLNDHIFPAEAKHINAQSAKIGAKLAMLEMLQTGTTTFNDMYFFEEGIAEAAQETGIRAMLSEGVLNFPTPSCPTPNEALKVGETLYKKHKNSEHIHVAISAHAPYTCSDELLQKSFRLAEELGLSFHIHLAETQWEFDKYKNELGKSPTQHLHDLGILKPNTLAAHAVHLTKDDIELFAKQGAHVAHNPACNMKLASGAAPIPELLNAGVNVGLGTDGVASNNNLNMFQEMYTAALLHKFNTQDPTTLDAKTIVKMATLNGAKAIGLGELIGSLEPNKAADIIFIDLNKLHATPCYNIYSQLVYATNGLDVTDVLVNGQFVLQNNRFVHVDADSTRNAVLELSQTIADAHQTGG